MLKFKMKHQTTTKIIRMDNCTENNRTPANGCQNSQTKALSEYGLSFTMNLASGFFESLPPNVKKSLARAHTHDSTTTKKKERNI